MSARDRRTELLDAALRVIAAGGLRAVTHRRVEQEAGAPHGSTTYWFKTRDQLVEAVVARLVEIDRNRTEGIGRAVTMALARRDGPPDLEPITAAILEWIEHDRAIQLARFELQSAAGRDPRIKELMSRASTHFWRMVEPVAVAAGSDDPPRDARVLVAMLDGLIIDYLTREPPDPDVFAAGMRRLFPPTVPPAT